MSSIKWRLAIALGLVEALTLAMALVLYVGAARLEQSAHRTSRANDEVRDLLSFALLAHRYMNAFGRSLGQRTLIANHERRTAAAAFEAQITSLRGQARATKTQSPLDWTELVRISRDLNAELGVADELRERGKFYDAERSFGRARNEQFDGRMLPWFEHAVSLSKAAVEAEETRAIDSARSLRFAGIALGSIAVLLGSALSVATATSILRPISRLLRGTTEIAQGNLGHRVKYAGRDELATLARHFNEMASTLSGAQTKLMERNTQLEEAHRLQSEFLSIVSHELRSPLHSVVGYTELVIEDELAMAPRSRDNMLAIASSAQRLLALINDILDFSKLRAGRMEAKPARFDLVPLLLQVVDEARALSHDRKLEVELASAPHELWLVSDETKVRQILTNLVSNAIKFTATGSVNIAAERSANGVMLSVEDTGLGLAIVARLSSLLGGTVSLTSELGRGSRFCVELPLSLQKEAPWPPS